VPNLGIEIGRAGLGMKNHQLAKGFLEHQRILSAVKGVLNAQ